MDILAAKLVERGDLSGHEAVHPTALSPGDGTLSAATTKPCVALVGVHDDAGAGRWHLLNAARESPAGPFATELEALRAQDALERRPAGVHTPQIVFCDSRGEQARVVSSGANAIAARRDRGRSTDRAAR